MESKNDVYEAEQLALEIHDMNQPSSGSITEEELIDLLAIALL